MSHALTPSSREFRTGTQNPQPWTMSWKVFETTWLIKKTTKSPLTWKLTFSYHQQTVNKTYKKKCDFKTETTSKNKFLTYHPYRSLFFFYISIDRWIMGIEVRVGFSLDRHNIPSPTAKNHHVASPLPRSNWNSRLLLGSLQCHWESVPLTLETRWQTTC